MKLLGPVFVLFLLLTCFFVFTEADFFNDFLNPKLRRTPHLSGSQLYTVDVGFNNILGSIGCFGDFNSDKFTDVFIISPNRTAVDVYLWDGDAWKFRLSAAHVESPEITNIAAGDFDYDGRLDLLVMGNHLQDVNGTNITTTYLKLYNGDLHTFTLASGSIPHATDQVLILDANNDLWPDLFGELPAETPGDPPRRAFWINNKRGGFDIHDQVSSNGAALSPLARPHSNGFADFNGDCLADLFITSVDAGRKQFEIWTNRKTGWELRSITPLPTGSGQVTFADFDGDGTLDLCVPVCDPPGTCERENSVRIVYNSQRPLCPVFNTKKISCRKATDLCSADDSYSLSNVSRPLTDVGAVVADGISTRLFGNNRFVFDDAAGRPLTVRTGDYNLDGFTDLIILVRDNIANVSRIELWTNVPAGSGRRGFARKMDGVAALNGVQNAYAAAFFDIDEDGGLDLLVLTDNPPGVVAVYNNFQNDAFFLKAVGLNGVCPAWCGTAPKFPDPKPYGVNFPGGIFKFTITDLTGTTHLAIGAQLSQSSYLSLSTPYVLFGLGRTSNYIEEFFYGIPINQNKHFSYWTGSTIPNSQVVAIPYKSNEPTGWTLELYTNPSGVMFWVIISVLISLIILGAAIYYLYRKEKQEDERTKQDQAHLFSFDAL